MSFLESTQKTGVRYNLSLKKKEFCSDNQWIQYLHYTRQSKMHFNDLFKKALNLNLNGLPEVSVRSHQSKIILFQTLTSDKKKNWPVAQWKQLMLKLLSEYPQYDYRILVSPDDLLQLKAEYSTLLDSVTLACTNMEESFELLKKSHLLITLDTAMKHLATWAGVPIIELVLGSSNPSETGAYQNGALILKSKVECAPCRHSNDCSQSQFLCHQDLSVESVFEAVRLQLQFQLYFQSHLKSMSHCVDAEVSLQQSSVQRISIRKDYLKSIVESHEQKELLKPIHFVESNSDGWWSCNSILNLKEGDHYERRSKKSIETDNQAYR
jgi:hypothetical protein